MRKFVVLVDGVVVREYTGMAPPTNIYPGQILEEVPLELDALRYYKKAGEFLELPHKPSAMHTFDVAEEVWKDARTASEKAELLQKEARQKRAELLQASDWAVTRAVETGQDVPASWLEYRAALRDITLQVGFPEVIVWPLLPE